MSFYAKASADFTGPLTVTIESNNGGSVAAAATVPRVGATWQEYRLTLQTGNVPVTSTNRFVIAAKGKGVVHVNLVSLFPPVNHERTGGALGARPVTGFRRDTCRAAVSARVSRQLSHRVAIVHEVTASASARMVMLLHSRMS